MASLKDSIKRIKKDRNSNLKGELVRQQLDKLFVTDVDNREERYGLHASAVITSEKEFCYREQVLSLFYKQNTGRELPIGLLRIFKQGNAIHDKWQTMFKEAKLAKYIEKTWFDERYDLSFTPDIEANILGDEVIVEIKSMNTFLFKKAESHPSGEKQLALYLYLRKKKWGFILAEDKNTQEFKIFVVKYSKEKVEPYVERLKIIQDYKKQFLETRKPPKRKCKDSECKRAQSCNMRDACWNVGNGRKKLTTKIRNDGKQR